MKFLGIDEQGAAIGGRIGDSLVGAGTTIAGVSVVPCSTRRALGSSLDIIQVAGGIQAVSLGAAIASTSSVSPLLSVGLAAAGGVEIGDAFNKIYARLSGQSLGEDIYDLVHPLTRD